MLEKPLNSYYTLLRLTLTHICVV